MEDILALVAICLGWVTKEYYSVVYIRSGLDRYRSASKEVLIVNGFQIRYDLRRLFSEFVVENTRHHA